MKRTTIAVAAVGIGIVLVGAAAWWALRGAPPAVVPDLRDAQRIAAGRVVYDRQCASCHGPNLEGQPDWKTRLPSGRLPAPPHDDSGHTWHHPSEVLFALTKNGLVPPLVEAGYASDMPAFGGVLTDDEIWNVLAYIQSRWSPRVRERHRELERQYAESRR
jgi:mono/diheme cytochrome c family protein